MEILEEQRALRSKLVKLGAEEQKSAEELAAAEQKTADEIRKRAEDDHQAAVDRARDLNKMLLDGLNRLQDEERDREHALEERLLKRGGDEEAIHQKRLQWIAEETREAVAAADTEEKRIAARLNGEGRARAELHSEKMRLLELEERAQQEADAAAKKARDDALSSLQGATKDAMTDPVAARAAIEQVYAARLQEARQEFGESGRGDGLTQAQLNRELELIRRQVHRQTVNDARNFRISPDELERSQEQIADSTARNAAANTRQNAGLAETTANLARSQEETDRFNQQLERRIQVIENGTRAQAERSRSTRGGLNG
ncbi:MAG: hypothetical protein H0T47_09625 [Planctomycetaceae bacterium]|nr:hypothetical protein [Planctomycetaceae bacterium]